MKNFKEFNKRSMKEVEKLSKYGVYYDFNGGYWFRITLDGCKSLLNKEEVQFSLKNK